MKLLLSNTPPVHSAKHENTRFCFENLIHQADGLRIASGYVSTDSLAELKKIIELNKKTCFIFSKFS